MKNIEKLYDVVCNNLYKSKEALGLVSEMLVKQLVYDLTGNANFWISLRKLNTRFPQVRVKPHGDLELYTVEGIGADGTFNVNIGGDLRELELNGDISEDSIIRIVTYLREVEKEIKQGAINAELDEEQEELVLTYPDEQ